MFHIEAFAGIIVVLTSLFAMIFAADKDHIMQTLSYKIQKLKSDNLELLKKSHNGALLEVLIFLIRACKFIFLGMVCYNVSVYIFLNYSLK